MKCSLSFLYAEADREFARAVVIHQALARKATAAMVLASRPHVQLQMGTGRAEAFAEEALALARRSGDGSAVLVASCARCRVHLANDQVTEASALQRALAEEVESRGFGALEVLHLCALGRVALREGRCAEARELLQEARFIAQSAGYAEGSFLGVFLSELKSELAAAPGLESDPAG